MFGLSFIFNRVNERELCDAVVKFGGCFYKAIRQSMKVSNVDMAILQMEFSLLAISVSNAFIGLRRSNSRKLMINNTKNVAMAYGIHFEEITKGKVFAQSYASNLINQLAAGQGMEYARIVCETYPEQQPKNLIFQFLRRVNATLPEAELETAIEGVAESLTSLIEEFRKIGI